MSVHIVRGTRIRRRRIAKACAVLSAASLSLAGVAYADTGSENKAAAEALFQQGKKLLSEGKYAEACAKLANSQQLEPATGTLMNLGDCQEKNGQIASAWATFKEAVGMARASSQTQREQVAQARASSLEPRLPQMVIAVPPGDNGVAEIRRDGAVVPRAVWGTALPVDPGEHVVQATGAGRRTWSQRVAAVEAKTTNVSVPALEVEPAQPTQPAAVAPPAPAPVPAVSPSPPPGPVPAPEQRQASDARGMSNQKWAALIVGGVGIGVAAVGSIVALGAK
jgi:hypothetical protein